MCEPLSQNACAVPSNSGSDLWSRRLTNYLTVICLLQEFFGAGLLHREEVELRKALQASLREAKSAHLKKQGKPTDPVLLAQSICADSRATESKHEEPADQGPTKSVCTGTNTGFRIKSSVRKKIEKPKTKQHGNLFVKKKDTEMTKTETSQEVSKVWTKPLKRKNVLELSFGPVEKKKKGSEERKKDATQKGSRKSSTKSGRGKGTEGITDTRKDLKSPTKTSKFTQFCKEKEQAILPKSKAIQKLCNRMKGSYKCKVVQSLTKKFNAVKDEKQPATKNSEDQTAGRACSNDLKKKTNTLQNDEVQICTQDCGPSGNCSKTDKICEVGQEVPNSLQGKVRRKLKHKFKNRRLVSPLGEIYIPANIAKTEDFLTFLCLRGKLAKGTKSVCSNMWADAGT